MTSHMAWADLSGWQWTLLAASLAGALAPYVQAWRHGTSLALATVLSLLLVFVVEFVSTWGRDLFGWDGYPLYLLTAHPPVVGEVLQLHRWVSSAWIHSGVLHILSNILVIGLVGVPLEQRLGRWRWMTIYLIGALGGGLFWWWANLGDSTHALGASGAAFGLLGAYLAGWPRDEIEFPLILIRRWPVSLIALLYFAMEIGRAYSETQGALEDGVGQLAHIGGFVIAYAALRPLARGGPVEVGAVDRGPSAGAADKARREAIRAQLGELSEGDPWSAAGVSLSRGAARALSRLRESGDEPETREAWMEQLAGAAACPVCKGVVTVVTQSAVPRLVCGTDRTHLTWP